ncbi:hypothetical protein D1Y84_04275 [Acidipila sp. EB88]|nr:hypothetical protein D1Y84_04275 [Acidipila sp. EB88]
MERASQEANTRAETIRPGQNQQSVSGLSLSGSSAQPLFASGAPDRSPVPVYRRDVAYPLRIQWRNSDGGYE